ncbi:MAG: hypothetical protein IJ407_05040 [Clostridia bacterium]|nr:hypothetical protein [Clostridia bacterium]
MKRKNVLSALLAVMMVISMMAVIAMPAVAAGEKTDLPSIQTATSSDAVTGYALSSVADLIWWGNNPTAVTAEDTVYLTKDIDIAAYGGTFADDFTSIRRTYASLDGQGHTIYGYNDDHAIFADRYYGKTIKNLIIDGAYVQPAQATDGILVRAIEADCIFDNVHFRNTTFIASNGAVTGLTYGYHGLFAGYINNRRTDFDITFRNCSVINSLMDCNGWSDCGLWTGVYRSGGKIAFENCVSLDSKVINYTDGTYMSLYGRMRDTYEVVFDNVGAINCELIGATAAQSITYMTGYEFYYLNNLFSVGNKTSSPGNSATADMDIVSLTTVTAANTVVENYLVDGGVTNITYHSKGSYTAASDPAKVVSDLSPADVLVAMNTVKDQWGYDYDDWGFDAEGNPVITTNVENAQPLHKITFNLNDAEGTVIALPTDINGHLVADEGTFAILKAHHWGVDGTVDYGNNYAWETEPFSGDLVLNAHTTSVEAIDGRHHKVTCTMAGCEETAETISCTGVIDPDGYIPADYFNLAQNHYNCAVCTNSWYTDDADSEKPAMLSIAFSKDAYDAGEMVALEIGVHENTKLSGFQLDLTYNSDQLTWVGKVDAADHITAAANADDITRTASVTAYTTDTKPVTAAGTWLTVYFKTSEKLNSDVLTAIKATLTEATVGGNETDVTTLLVLGAEDTAMIYAGCTPGDVNRSGVVDLLDVVLTIEALDGTLDADDVAIFSVRAANVDGDEENVVNTKDVTYLIRHQLGWAEYATLNQAKPGTAIAAAV